MRKFTHVLIAAAATLAVSAGIAAPKASASYVSLENKNSTKLLEVPGWSTANWTTLGQWYSNRLIASTAYAGENQQWVIPAACQTGMIWNRNSRKCVATNGAGRPVYQATCTGGWEQMWTRTAERVTDYEPPFDVNSAVYSKFKNPGTGLVLDVNGASHDNGAAVISWYPNGADNQYWEVDASNLW